MTLRQFLPPLLLVSMVGALVGCNATAPEVGSQFGSATEVAADRSTVSTRLPSAEQAIVLTDIDFDPETLIPETQPVAEYLATQLQSVGIRQGLVKIAPDSATLADWMASGQVNLFFDSVYPVMKVMEQTGGTPILRRWKDGVAEYHTLFIARRDRGLTAIADLEGSVIAMQNPDSSSGFMFPMVYLLQRNLRPVEQAEANHPVPYNQIGYVFSGRDETTAEWVLSGKVTAGAIDNEVFEALPERDRKQLMILAKTESYPRHLVLVGQNFSAPQVEAIKTALMRMHHSSQGQKALKEFGKTAKFDEFPEGAEVTIDRLTKAYQRLQIYLKEQASP